MLTVSFSVQESVGYGANHGGDKMKNKSGNGALHRNALGKGSREMILLFCDSKSRFAQWSISFAMISSPFWSRAVYKLVIQ